MDSPDFTKSTTTTTATATATIIINKSNTFSNSPQVQDSPFPNYLSCQSPIQSVKAPHSSEIFLGPHSPTIVFTSPTLKLPLERSQNTQLSSTWISEHDAGTNIYSHGLLDVDESLLIGTNLKTHAQDTGGDKDVQVKPNGSSICADEYLAEHVEEGIAYSEYLIDSELKQSNHILQSSLNVVNEGTVSQRSHSEFDSRNDRESQVDAPLALSKMYLNGAATLDVEQVKLQKDKRSYTSMNNSRSGCGDECNCSQEVRPENLQITEAFEGCGENVEAIPNGSVYNIPENSEVSLHQQGLTKRCLQFEECQSKETANLCLEIGNNAPLIQSPGAASESDTFTSSIGDSHVTSSSKHMVNVSQHIPTLFRPCNGQKSSIPVLKASGIGLHLNSIMSAVPMGHGATSLKLEDGHITVKGMKSLSDLSTQSILNIRNGSKLSSFLGKTSIVSEDRAREMEASISANSAIPDNLNGMESVSLMLADEDHATHSSKRKLLLDPGGCTEEVNQHSSKKTKKQDSITDADGCKSCNCKKSRCLKLYCDCFAAGIYCGGPCACKGCYNMPQYEKTVLEMRELIETRNPYAFAPKIVQHVPELIEDQDDSLTIPSLVKHKRGCSCKKSSCVKKYCECYQATAGCSTGCRCEGCKNVYGRRDEHTVTEESMSKKVEMAVTNKVLWRADNPHKLQPRRRSFQCAGGALTYYNMVPQSGKEISELSPYNHETDNVNKDDAYQFTQSNLPSMSIRSLTSSKQRELTSSRHQLRSGSGQLSAGSSPATQMTRLDLDKGLHEILEDETPEILKDTSTPTNSLRVSFPNCKRVSPNSPHDGSMHELGSSSSREIKSGRKFILKAVSPFPSLTSDVPERAINQTRGNS